MKKRKTRYAQILFNTSYSYISSDKLRYYSAFSFSNNTDNIKFGRYPLYRHDSRAQGRAELNYNLSQKLSLLAGMELQSINYDRIINDTTYGRFSDSQIAGYLETEWKPVRWFGLKTGIRAEYSSLLSKADLAPRISMAIKTGEKSQISAAYGIYYQSAPADYLIQGYTPGFQQAVHYLINFQRIKIVTLQMVHSDIRLYLPLTGRSFLGSPYHLLNLTEMNYKQLNQLL